MWSNVASEITIFECDTYGFYSDPVLVARLVDIAGTIYRNISVFVDIRPRPRKLTAGSSSDPLAIGNNVVEIFNDQDRVLLKLNKWTETVIEDLYRQYASYERWVFSIPRAVAVNSVPPESDWFTLERQLTEAVRWDFGLHIDLDSMLIGFIPTGVDADTFREAVTELGWAKQIKK